MAIEYKTPLTQLHEYNVAALSPGLSRKLAAAAASFAGKTDVSEANVGDLLAYFPMRYEDRSNMMPIEQLYDGIESSVLLYTRVSGGYRVGKNRPRGAPPLYIFEVSAGDLERKQKPVVVWWFVSGKSATRIVNYWKERFSRGTRFVAYGRWEWDSRRGTLALKLAKPDELEILPDVTETGDPVLPGAEEAGEETDRQNGPGGEEDNEGGKSDAGPFAEESSDDPKFDMVHVGRRVPVYRKLGPFQTKRLREIISDILDGLDPGSVDDHLPKTLQEKLRLISRAEALSEIHFPPESADLRDYAGFRSEAHRRLIFEEFFWVSFAMQLMRSERTKEPKGAQIRIGDETRGKIRELAPFELTGAQRRVLGRILDDMGSDSPMNRLIQGDVGSGKTIVALLAMFAAMESGFQTAFMAPTEILAGQHAINAKRLFKDTPYEVGLLIGGLKAAEKKNVREQLASGGIRAVIGTHAIIQDKVEFEKLGLAVIDEQHRFGVLQRAELRERGYNPDILVMTATPIPRSLAMTVYGDLDVSVIDELPPGRTPVKTVVVGEDKRKGVYKGIEREIRLGRQVYVVYPLIEESEKLDLKAATEMYEQLRDKIFPDRNVGLLHGKLKAAEKAAIMKDFVAGKLNILVSTTVIEVGVDVQNASLMVIEHAERFGLSQLHQLRGRVGRGADQSFCVLLTGDKKTAVARERLGIMEETSDGFRIAEKDLELRGQGDVLGTRQSGIQAFRIGNIIRDLKILEAAKNEAGKLIELKDTDPEVARLIEAVRSDSRFRLGAVG